MLKEELLHFVWKYQLFEKRSLYSTEGELIEVVFPGYHNHDAGPDFLDARIRIGDKLWAGNIEIHIHSADWKKHEHQNDPSYKNIILHVVYEDNEKAEIRNFPTLTLKYRIPGIIKKNYRSLMQSSEKIPCSDYVIDIEEITKTLWVQRMTAERFEHRNEYINNLLELTGDWHESFYMAVARSLGYRVNADAFEKLARITPQKLIARHKNNLFQIEALLFGQAGLLQQDFKDEYAIQLASEYQFLKSKYHLSGMSISEWKFARLRPADFPTIRIAQFSMLLYNVSNLFSAIIEAGKNQRLQDFFRCETSSYWLNHYIFDQETSSKKRKKIGQSAINRIIINAVVPFLFSYGKYKNQEDLTRKALNLLESLPKEQNSLLTQWETLGFKNENAADSQGLLHLRKQYCDQKKCLYCSIGTAILQKKA